MFGILNSIFRVKLNSENLITMISGDFDLLYAQYCSSTQCINVVCKVIVGKRLLRVLVSKCNLGFCLRLYHFLAILH